MEISRNQYFMAGIVVLLLGLQLRFVDSYVLTPESTKILAERFGKNEVQRATAYAATTISPRKVIRPPEWAGWFMMSFGSVLILHSLAMKRSG